MAVSQRTHTSPLSDLMAGAVLISPAHDMETSPILHHQSLLQQAPAAIASATLACTAHGIYEARINGEPVSDTVLNPGWTTYESRLQVQRFEVTGHLRRANKDLEVAVHLGRGWWGGDMGLPNKPCNYGDYLGFLGALEITYKNGDVQRVVTDQSWTATNSFITFATFYDGQHEDRRIDRGDPRSVCEIEFDRDTLVEQVSPPIRRHESARPQKIWTSRSGKLLVDFGQNLVGWLRFTVSGAAGTEIVLRHAEVLENNELGTRPLRTAKATDRIVLSGEGQEVFEPTFTFHGFRYVEVSGWPGDLTADDIEAVVVHSEMRRTGTFECSHPLVNQLIHNSVWSQKGNFLAVPTDCPQRDERLGWTGDIAAYAATATYQFDASRFLHNWLLDLAAEVRNNVDGFVPFVVPDIIKYASGAQASAEGTTHWGSATAIWGDAAVWVPEALWLAYGDLDRLREHYPGMVMHLASVEKKLSPTGLWDTGWQFGDWLDPDAPPEEADAAKADKGVVATACLYRSATFAAKTARLLGESADVEHWQSLADRTRDAFLEHYVDDEGRIYSDASTVYSLAIVFDILPSSHRPAAGNRLAELVRAADYRISTGFAGTPYVTWALSETGHVDEAYRLLLEEQCPSWLYPITMGATTIWERWDSLLPDGSINPGEMTSFNHYALGAVADWIYQVVLGIRPAEAGYTRVKIQPTPGPGIDWARGALECPHGRIEVQWSTLGPTFDLEITVPAGIEADVLLLDGSARRIIGTGSVQKIV